jgi:hypothetical protein
MNGEDRHVHLSSNDAIPCIFSVGDDIYDVPNLSEI